MDYVDERGFEWGKQASGVVGFWVPRIFWYNKPVPTGVHMGAGFIGLMESTRNTNLSCPVPAEGYIDFGIAGVVIYGLIFGIIIGLVDRLIPLIVYGRGHRAGLNFSWLVFPLVVLPVVVGMMLFLLRGSLMPAFAYTLGSLASGFVVYWFFTSGLPNAPRAT